MQKEAKCLHGLIVKRLGTGRSTRRGAMLNRIRGAGGRSGKQVLIGVSIMNKIITNSVIIRLHEDIFMFIEL